MPASYFQSAHGFRPETNLERAAEVLGVSAPQLLLYHLGTSEEPGLAVQFRQKLEASMAASIGYRVPFASERELQRFALAASALNDPISLPDPQLWARSSILPSFRLYLCHIARCLQEMARGHVIWDWYDKGKKRRRGKAAHYTGDWLKIMNEYLQAHELDGVSRRTLYSWASRGEEASSAGCWYLRHIRFVPTDEELPSPADIGDASPPPRHKHYHEIWARKGRAAAKAWWVIAPEVVTPTIGLKLLTAIRTHLLPGVGVEQRWHDGTGANATFVGPYRDRIEAGGDRKTVRSITGAQAKIESADPCELHFEVPAAASQWSWREP